MLCSSRDYLAIRRVLFFAQELLECINISMVGPYSCPGTLHPSGRVPKIHKKERKCMSVAISLTLLDCAKVNFILSRMAVLFEDVSSSCSDSYVLVGGERCRKLPGPTALCNIT